jgi:hypothetical protein
MTGFNFSTWIDRAEEHDLSESAWLLINAFAALGDKFGSMTHTDLLDWLERDAETPATGAMLAAIDGSKELAKAHLLLDLGERLVAVLPQISTTRQEA